MKTSSARKFAIMKNAIPAFMRRENVQPHSAMQTEFTHPHLFKKRKVKKARRR